MQDARARKHRGIVTWGTRLDEKLTQPAPPARFLIAMLTEPSEIERAPERTAIVVPGVPRLRALRPGADVPLPRKIADLTLPPHKMAEYAAGRIVMNVEGVIEPEDVFPSHGDHPRLDRLALAIVEAAGAEETAPFLAVIRHELAMAPGADALAGLGERLAPPDARERPSPRAPGVLRLARALRQLRDGATPSTSLEQLTEDLRFLRMFDAEGPVLAGDALDKLFDDVAAGQRAAKEQRDAAKIVPLRRKRDPE